MDKGPSVRGQPGAGPGVPDACRLGSPGWVLPAPREHPRPSAPHALFQKDLGAPGGSLLSISVPGAASRAPRGDEGEAKETCQLTVITNPGLSALVLDIGVPLVCH